MSDTTHETYTIHPDKSDPKSAPTVIVGAVGVILTIVIVLLLQVLFYRTAEAENVRKIVEQEPVELGLVQAEQREKLNGYTMIDASAGIVTIPIERAMQLVVSENAASGGDR